MKILQTQNGDRQDKDQSSRSEVAVKYRVDDLPGSNLSGSRIGKVLKQLEANKPLSELTLNGLKKKGFIALQRYAANRTTYDEYVKEAELERTERCKTAEVKAAKIETERKRKADAVQKRFQAARERAEVKKRAYENDPRNIAKEKQYRLREKYDLTFFIEKPDYPRLMKILRRVDSGARLSEKDVVWLSTAGEDYYTQELREAFHYNEAIFYAAKFKKDKDPWAAVNASSQFRKCNKSSTADNLLSSIKVQQYKKLKLKSALYTTHGGVKRDLCKWDEALALADQARELTPDNFRPYTLLGAINMEIGQYDKGQSWYQKAIKLGFSEKSMDSDLRSIFRRSDKAKKIALRDHLLSIDPFRYSWTKKI